MEDDLSTSAVFHFLEEFGWSSFHIEIDTRYEIATSPGLSRPGFRGFPYRETHPWPENYHPIEARDCKIPDFPFFRLENENERGVDPPCPPCHPGMPFQEHASHNRNHEHDAYTYSEFS